MQKTYPCSKKRSYIKRKHCLLKKAMEFSLKCNQEIFLVVFDRKTKQYVQYQSDDNFDLSVKKLQHNHFSSLSRESYNNQDFNSISKIISEREMQDLQISKVVEPTKKIENSICWIVLRRAKVKKIWKLPKL